jgi:hypothetical protein
VLKEAFWARPQPDDAEFDFVLVARVGIGKVIEQRGLDGAIECVDEVMGRKATEAKDPDRST